MSATESTQSRIQECKNRHCRGKFLKGINDSTEFCSRACKEQERELEKQDEEFEDEENEEQPVIFKED